MPHRRLMAGLTGGTLASTSLVASASAFWASLPVEVRGFIGALIAGFVAELATVARAWVRARASRALGVRVPDDQASPAEAPSTDPAAGGQASSSPAQSTTEGGSGGR